MRSRAPERTAPGRKESDYTEIRTSRVMSLAQNTTNKSHTRANTCARVHAHTHSLTSREVSREVASLEAQDLKHLASRQSLPVSSLN